MSELTGGRWVTVGGIKRWIRDGVAVADHMDNQRRHQMLRRERLDLTWWTTPRTYADDPQVIRRRVAALAAEFDAYDGRIKEAS